MGDELTKIRFYIPGTISKLKATGQNAGSQNEDGEGINSARVFYDTKDKARPSSRSHSQVWYSLDTRYDMDMFPTSLLQGKTYDYNIVYVS